MAKVKTKEIFTKEVAELRNNISKARQELSDLLLDHSQFKLKNTRQIFNKKKEIARLATIIRAKELAKEEEINKKI